jgi:hypothetical protein
VKNIAHCTQTDNEQAEIGLRVQSLIFAQREQLVGFDARPQGLRADLATPVSRPVVLRAGSRA